MKLDAQTGCIVDGCGSTPIGPAARGFGSSVQLRRDPKIEQSEVFTVAEVAFCSKFGPTAQDKPSILDRNHRNSLPSRT